MSAVRTNVSLECSNAGEFGPIYLPIRPIQHLLQRQMRTVNRGSPQPCWQSEENDNCPEGKDYNSSCPCLLRFLGRWSLFERYCWGIKLRRCWGRAICSCWRERCALLRSNCHSAQKKSIQARMAIYLKPMPPRHTSNHA